VIDTVACCPPLTSVEKARLKELVAKEEQRLSRDATKARGEYIAAQSRRLAERTGMDADRARGVVERQLRGLLLPDVKLEFVDPR
jgi:hypothetical protein